MLHVATRLVLVDDHRLARDRSSRLQDLPVVALSDCSEDQHEFVAAWRATVSSSADAAQRSAMTGSSRRDVCAQAVVDVLELVEVDVRPPSGMPAFGRSMLVRRSCSLGGWEPGQRVVVRVLFQLHLVLLARADVTVPSKN